MLEGIGRFDHARYGYCIVPLCQGKIQNKDFYAFVAIEPHNYPYFKKHYRQGIASSFDAYGKELLRGWGTMPPEDILDHISRKYNVEFGVDRPFVEHLVTLTNNSANGSRFPLETGNSLGVLTRPKVVSSH